jgi:endothelin-converting enzyme/putative endopeptidase
MISRLKMPLVFILAFTASLLFAQNAKQNSAAPPEVHGVQLSHIDHSVKPGDDFFEYANGAWIKETTIPPDRASVGVFNELFELTSKRTADLIQEISKSNPAAGSPQRKIADLYNSYMDEAGIEKKGLAPAKPYLDRIAKIKDKKELAHALGESLRADVDALNNTNFHTPNIFGLWVAPDFNDPEHYTAYLLQGGIVMPDREYYVSDNPNMKELRDKYVKHISAMLKLAGFSDTDAKAQRIFDLEHAIAEKHWSLAENDDIHKANNPWKQADFTTKAPGLDWKEFFKGAGLAKQQAFIVWQPTAFTGEAALVESTPLDTWKDYLAFHFLEGYGGVLPKAFADERFSFFGTALAGVPQQRPRWQRAIFVVDGFLDDEVGKIYAQKYFPPEAKAAGEAMVANIKEAFQKRIDALGWMDPSTKAEAKSKLAALYVGIGYPEHWHDYTGYKVDPKDIFANVYGGDLFHYHWEVGRLGRQIDRQEWSMSPQTVNAVNLPLYNALNFPAAILQPPFFDPKAPAAVNYGAIGSIIGHEVSHTFDTEGSTFDAKGRVRNWWKPADLAHFEAATKRLVEQYDAYYPFPDLHVNGAQTITENIADVAGIAASYDGWKASLNGQPAPEQDGLTGDQQFFLAFGQNWADKTRPAALRQRVLTDQHSPDQYRADTVRNIDAWYPAFNVQPGEKLYLAPADRVRIW